MTAPIKVTIGEIEALALRLRDGTRAMDDILEKLDSEVATLTGEWTGAATEAYATAQKQWRSTMGEMRDTLEQFSRDTIIRATTYEDASRAVGKIWGR